jgi:hypothetical protein
MNSSDVNKIKKIILPQLTGFSQNRMMLYRESNSLLKCIYFDGSDYEKRAFYVWMLFLPLYIPTNNIYFTFGKRVAGGTRWMLEDNIHDLFESIRNEAIPFFEIANTPKQFAEQVVFITGNPRDPYVIQAEAYSHLKSGNYAAAGSLLKRLIMILDCIEPKPDWIHEMLARNLRVLDGIDNNIEHIQQLLKNWEEISRVKLHLS